MKIKCVIKEMNVKCTFKWYNFKTIKQTILEKINTLILEEVQKNNKIKRTYGFNKYGLYKFEHNTLSIRIETVDAK